MKKTTFTRGFTLAELIIALAISSLVASGLYVMFSSAAGIRNSNIKQSENTLVIQSLSKLLNRDTRMMMENSMSVDASDEIKKLKFTTHNSLRFNKAVPAEVIYYVEDGWLMRRETNNQLLYDMEMRLLPDVKNITFEFYNGNEYQEELTIRAKKFIMTVTINETPIKIFAARTFDNVQ